MDNGKIIPANYKSLMAVLKDKKDKLRKQLVDKVRHVESKSNQESLEMVQRVFKASLDDKQMESPSDLLHCGENAAVVQHEGGLKKLDLSSSIRSRLMETLKTVKDKAKEEVYNKERASHSLTKIQQEECKDHEILESSIVEKMQEMELMKFNVSQDVAKPSIGEQMDFCLKVFHEVAKELKEDHKVENRIDDIWMPYFLEGPVYSFHKESEIFHYCYPSSLPANKRFFIAGDRRDLKKEGYYVGHRPQVEDWSLNRVENRLITEKSRGKDEEVDIDSYRLMKWFNEDGRLISLIDPVKESSNRPSLVNEDAFLVSPFVKPELQDNHFIGEDKQFMLDMDINSISFSHHHLFSKEHVLASRLKELYQLYALKEENCIVDYLNERFHALKSTIFQIEENIKLNKLATEFEEEELQKFKNELRLVKKQRDEELDLHRKLLKDLLALWKEIKMLQSTSKCINTNIKLIIIREDMDFEDDLKKWEADLTEEHEWVKEEVLTKFNNEYSLYLHQLELWKDQKMRIRSAKKRIAIRKKRSTNHSDFEDSEYLVVKDNETLAGKIIDKPSKPTMISDSEIRQEVIEKFEIIKRKPGEPKIVLHLSGDAVITPIKECPIEEQLRRIEVSQCILHVKVVYNGKIVGRTDKRNLEQDFTVRLREILNVRVTHWPENIAFEVYEDEQLLSTVYVMIPEVNFPPGKLMKYEFGCCINRKYSHAAVGSGDSFSLECTGSTRNVFLNTSGILVGCVTWSPDALPCIRKSSLDRSKVTSDIISSIGLHGLNDKKMLLDWLKIYHLDPNDPTNVHILHLNKPLGIAGFPCQNASGVPSYFRLEHLLEEFCLSSNEHINNSRRFQMIEMREAQAPGFKNCKVPMFDREINEELFLHLEKQNEHDELVKGDDIDAYRMRASKFLQQVHSSIMKKFWLTSTKKNYSEVINENNVPNISFILSSLNSILEPKRPLKPVRMVNKKVAPKNHESQIRVLINIIRAFGIPVRSSSDRVDTNIHGRKSIYMSNNSTMIGSINASINPWNDVNKIFNNSYENLDEKNIVNIKVKEQQLVCPFVEVSFQQNMLSTSVSAGSQPIWNEELNFTFRPLNDDYSVSSLHSCNDLMYFNIYDHFVIDDCFEKINTRTEKRWLGSLKIPFSTIFINDKIDGTFKIQRPPFLLGYSKQETNSEFIDMALNDGIYLSLLITLDAKLPYSLPLVDKLSTIEAEDVSTRCEDWLNGLKKQFSNRNFLATVTNFYGSSVLATRYLKPIQPPPRIFEGISDEDQKLLALSRYVSLIPNVSSNVMFPGFCDVWATSLEFLKLLQGGEEEHAVLLANYFLYLGFKAWIVIGTAIPEGKTAYVLMKNNSSGYSLWKASSGQKYSHLDNYCSLKSIGSVIGTDNIWGNTQGSDRSNQLSFNFDDTSKWRPLFNNKFPYPNLSSVQPDALEYINFDNEKIKNLQELIESEIRKNVSMWRKNYITRWNRYCIQIFRKLLARLEEQWGKEISECHSKELENDLSSYSVSGFPLNIPYIGIKEILDVIHSTRFYDINANDVEFAIAVHINPFPGCVMSVWIYIASLIKKR